MKGKILLTLAIAICIMTGCKKEKQSEQPRQERTAEQSVEQKQTSETSNQEATAYKTPRKVKELSFFGHTLILNSEDSIYLQLEDIASTDKMLSVEKNGNDSPFVLEIGNVQFGVNANNGFSLMTSTQPNDPKMKTVINYINNYYGKPDDDSELEDDEFVNLKWGSFEMDAQFWFGYVQLRRVRGEEGGTVIIFRP